MLRMPLFVSSNGSNTSPSDAIKRTIPLFLRRQVQEELDKSWFIRENENSHPELLADKIAIVQEKIRWQILT